MNNGLAARRWLLALKASKNVLILRANEKDYRALYRRASLCPRRSGAQKTQFFTRSKGCNRPICTLIELEICNVFVGSLTRRCLLPRLDFVQKGVWGCYYLLDASIVLLSVAFPIYIYKYVMRLKDTRAASRDQRVNGASDVPVVID